MTFPNCQNVEHIKTLCSSFGTQHIDVVNKGIPKKQKFTAVIPTPDPPIFDCLRFFFVFQGPFYWLGC